MIILKILIKIGEERMAKRERKIFRKYEVSSECHEAFVFSILTSMNIGTIQDYSHKLLQK